MWNTEMKKSCLSAIFSVPSSVNRVVGEEHQYFRCVETFEGCLDPHVLMSWVLVSAA